MVTLNQKLYRVFCIGTADTKIDELLFLSESVTSSLAAFSDSSPSRFEVTVGDVSTSESETDFHRFSDFVFVSRNEILSEIPTERGEAFVAMSEALDEFLKKSIENGVAIVGVFGVGGSGGTSLISRALRSLPIGLPKLIVSTAASGNTEPYIGTSDLILFPSIVDICGINSVSRVVLSNAASALAGMVIGSSDRLEKKPRCGDGERPTVGLTMFGVTTPCVNAVKERLVREGYETLVFHATGVGGRAMESLVREGFIKEVLDITTTEVADYVVGGVMACDSTRFDSIIEKKIPLVPA